MPDHDPLSTLATRREFLRQGACIAGAVALVGPLAHATPVEAPLWDLTASEELEEFADGSSVPFFRYRARGRGATRGRLPFFSAEEGRPVAIRVHNQTTQMIRPEVSGVVIGPEIDPGEQGMLRFTMPAEGTYVLREGRGGVISDSLGMGAALVSRAAGGIRPKLSAYDKEVVLVYQDCDDRWNRAVAEGRRPDTSVYEPNYFTTNGLSFPELGDDPDSRIVCNVGDRVLIRFVNLGLMRQSIHFHGYHVEILTRDNQPETALAPKDTFAVTPGGSTVVLLVPHQAGVYPVHPHSLTAVTANGTYPYGQLALIEAV